MKIVCFVAIVSVLSACTNHLYQGKTHYMDQGRECEALVYWYNTTHWLNDSGKATTVVIRNASNASSLQFSEDDLVEGRDHINLIESPNDYVQVIGQQNSNSNELNCGYFAGKQAHQNGTTNTTELYLICNKKAHPLRPDVSGLRAQETPYVFNMSAPQSVFSWQGALPPVDLNLHCR